MNILRCHGEKLRATLLLTDGNETSMEPLHLAVQTVRPQVSVRGWDVEESRFGVLQLEAHSV